MSLTFNTTTSKAPAVERFHTSAISSAVLVVATGMGLVACGGGGGSTSSPAPAPVMLSGQAVKGPVTGGQVCAYTLDTPRQQIACATTDSNAKYSLALPAGTGEVLIEVTGGSYIDEATGNKVALTTPLRTLSKAGDANNALITPFTELAVQRASVSNPGGNLSLVGFQTQIGQLEAGLGITGLASSNPFSGKTEADQKYVAALTAFSKQQSGTGKSVGDLLTLMGSQIDKCGISSAGATLSAYSNIGLTASKSSSGGLMQQQSLMNVNEPVPNNFSALSMNIDSKLPVPCTDSLVIDGQTANFADLASSNKPASWSKATQVDLTICSASKVGLQAEFPLANLVMHVPNDWFSTAFASNSAGTLNTNGSTIFASGGALSTSNLATLAIGNNALILSAGSVSSTGGILTPTLITGGGTLNIQTGFMLPGLPPMINGSNGLQMDSKGCLQSLLINWQTFSVGSGGGSLVGVGFGSGSTPPVDPNAGLPIIGTISAGSGGGSINISGGGLTTNGGSSGSGSGGLVLVGGKSGS